MRPQTNSHVRSITFLSKITQQIGFIRGELVFT